MDDHPFARSRRVFIGCKRDLTTSTSVNSASDEGQRLDRANRHRIGATGRIVNALTLLTTQCQRISRTDRQGSMTYQGKSEPSAASGELLSVAFPKGAARDMLVYG